MAILQERTREQLRVAVGQVLGVVYPSSASADGSTATLKDNSLALGGTDTQKGKWILFTLGANDGLISQVTASAVAANVTTHTFAPARTSTVSGDTYELWDEAFDPRRIHELINQAIIEATSRAYDPVESLALHADRVTTRFDIPSGISFLTDLAYRKSVSFLEIQRCNAVWTELVDADVTASLDTKDYKEGAGSLKLVVAAGVAAGDILATQKITSKNLSGYDTLEFWIKSTVAIAAGDYQILLDDTASCASPLESLNVPVLTADTWTFCRVSLANPRLDTAIISVGVKFVIDKGACTIWVDDIKVVVNSSAVWKDINWRLWDTDAEARDLIISAGVRDHIGYSLLKMTGGDKLALLSADATATELDEEYIVAFAAGHMLLSVSGGPTTDPDARRQLGQFWLAKAAAAKAALPVLENARPVG